MPIYTVISRVKDSKIPETESRAGHMNQRPGLFLSEQAVGMAIHNMLESIGWTADKQSIIEAIRAKVSQSHSLEYPDQLNEVTIKVNVTNKYESRKIEVKVQTRCGEVLGQYQLMWTNMKTE